MEYGPSLNGERRHSFREENNHLIVSDILYLPWHGIDRYAYFKTHSLAEFNVYKKDLRGVDAVSSIEFIVDLDKISPKNVESYLENLTHPLCDVSWPTKIDENNCSEYCFENLVAYIIASNKAILLDSAGRVYEYNISAKGNLYMEKYLGIGFPECFEGLLFRGFHSWPDS